MRTVIFSGLVSSTALPRRRSGGYSLAIGEPPVNFYSPVAMGDLSIKAGDFIAIAGKKTFVPWAKYVALAYRPLGAAGPARTLGAGWPLMCLGFGIVAGYFVLMGALHEPRGPEAFLPMILLGIFGMIRLVAMWQAVALLNRMTMPLTTHLSES